MQQKLLKQRALDAAGNRIDVVGCRDDHVAIVREAQANDVVARNKMFDGNRTGRDLDDPVTAFVASDDI